MFLQPQNYKIGQKPTSFLFDYIMF